MPPSTRYAHWRPLGYPGGKAMTRYTFVLLVCRVTGVLSVLNVLETLSQMIGIIGSFRFGGRSWPVLPIVLTALGAGLVLAGCLVGLASRKISSGFRSALEHRAKLLPVGFLALVLAYMTGQMGSRLAEVGLISWGSWQATYGRPGGDKLSQMLLQGVGAQSNPITQNLELAAAALAGCFWVMVSALRQKGPQDYSA
jgi:hypothetical protein